MSAATSRPHRTTHRLTHATGHRGAGRTLHWPDARGLTFTARDGTAWLTIDGDPRDIVLTAGQHVTIEQAGAVVVTAIDGPLELDVQAPPRVARARWVPLRRAWALLRMRGPRPVGLRAA